ncbi:hypothetical protein ROHU_003392 [Labeo rohita]|uniref:Uncharacterized protein n=1 Tax=Labeo rohita TaxID=84645 RepID=A0A498NWH2_LABRO|nr:hypothetical protein ROHU_003392 [Labeo rohita]
MGPHPFFLHGVAAFFNSDYVFNLEYPAAGSSTLEFIQRCFLGINPERGSKTKKRTTMNPHVKGDPSGSRFETTAVTAAIGGTKVWHLVSNFL